MYNFFVDINNKKDNRYFISGADFNHIKNVLRMNIGEEFLVSCNGNSDLCRVQQCNAYKAIP